MPNEENGYTGVITRYDEKRRLIGLEGLSEEESKVFSDKYIWQIRNAAWNRLFWQHFFER